jgi:ethanolamine kinase
MTMKELEPVILDEQVVEDVQDTVSSKTALCDPFYAMNYFLDRTSSQAGDDDDPYSAVKQLVLQVFSKSAPPHKYTLEVSELKGGITNFLLQGVYSTTSRHSPTHREEHKFLVRAYGNGTGTIIDRDREFSTHLSLYALSLAPPLYSRFGNGLIYGYITGRAAHYTELSHPEIMRAVSNRLAEWHVKLDKEVIETHIMETKRQRLQPLDFSLDIWDIIYRWVEAMPSGVVKATKDELRRELAWIKATIGNSSPEVVAHCDLLSGNILVPPQWDSKLASGLMEITPSLAYTPSQLVTFIDYEYTMPAPRGFDIANHFMEWQGFDCRTELIPKPTKENPVLRYWAFHYLSAVSHFSGSSTPPSDRAIDALIQELVSWWGMPGFYWGIWAAIQSTISDIDFDYATYARSRLDEYYEWKKTVFSSQL